MKKLKLILLTVYISTAVFAVNPGDTGTEAWRDFGMTPAEQRAFRGVDWYYPSGIPYEDETYYWAFEDNCVQCIGLGLPTHNPALRGCSFKCPRGTQPDDPFIYIRCWNQHGYGNAVYWRPSLTEGKWILLGTGHFPPNAVVTIKVVFDGKAAIVNTINDNTNGFFKIGHWPSKIFWLEFHLGGEPFKIVYNYGGYEKEYRIPPEHADTPNGTIIGFNPYGSDPTLTFVAKPSQTNHSYMGNYDTIYDRYWIIASTNLLEGFPFYEKYFHVERNTLIEYPINTAGKQRFYKIYRF